ncbi:proteasome component ECM29 [Monoraphidium neglectum]|uniref:Proteasome component ECM29 n=1 Tax=Monoraphidium neglectum TaxID=145388 RepID=A0A0D2MPR7_9CHLO|nr:proteasome component ECM29 [Monoraphidium neglectum]KIZ04640.1 proteasome component ECM29 [Monoraphidium neglectum]|eukprot:XP_013903659.1 proteasome component ECM29 [Monoraphidium neglectum]
MQTLQKLLPLVIEKLSTQSALVRAKVLELLGHVNKRLKAARSMGLPLLALARLATGSLNPMVRSFGLVYTEMAVDRAPAGELTKALIAGATAGSPVLSSGAGVAVNGGSGRAGGGAAAEAGGGDAEMGEAGGAVPGASGSETVAPAPEAAALLQPAEVLIPLLVAACDPSEPVSRRGEALARRLCGVESPKTSVDLEDAGLVGRLMALVLGGGGGGVEAGKAATPVGPALAARIMQLLVRSVAAAQRFPENARVLSVCLYGPGAPSSGGGQVPLGAPSGGATGRLRALGMEWCVWVIKHSPQHQLKAMAPSLLERLLPATGGGGAAIGGGTGGGDAMQVDGPSGGAGGGPQDAAMRGWAYQAVAALAQRLPEHFEGDVGVARRFFGALASEPAGSRSALQEAVSSLAGAYSLAAARRRQRATAAAANDGGVAGAAGDGGDDDRWFTRLFPPSHAPSRYACCLAAGDPKPEIRDAGLRGLALAPGGGGYGPQALGGGAGGAGGGGGAGQLLAALYPAPKALLAVAVSKHPGLSGAADPNRPLPMNDRALEALVAFLGCCR